MLIALVIAIFTMACDAFTEIEFSNRLEYSVELTEYFLAKAPEPNVSRQPTYDRLSNPIVLGEIESLSRRRWGLFPDPPTQLDLEQLHVFQASDPFGNIVFRRFYSWDSLVDVDFQIEITDGPVEEFR